MNSLCKEIFSKTNGIIHKNIIDKFPNFGRLIIYLNCDVIVFELKSLKKILERFLIILSVCVS